MNDTIYKIDLTDISRTCNSNAADYIFLSAVQGMESNHILGHKACLKNTGKLK